MRLPDALQGWLSAATGQMRWKRARPCAEQELRAHLEDQYGAFLEEGLDEVEAAERTVREMGDPVETGTRLDRAWRPAPDWFMLGLVLALAAVGMVLQYHLRQPWVAYMGISSSPLSMAGIYVIGVCCLLAAYFVDYTVLGKHIRLLYGLWCAVGALMVLETPFRQIISGANFYLRQWVWFFPLLFAGVLYANRGKGTSGVQLCLAALLPLWFFCLTAPATGAMIVMTVVCCALLAGAVWRGMFGGKRKGQLCLACAPLMALAAGAAMLIWRLPHLRNRLAVLFNPTLDREMSGYQGSVVWEALFGGVFPAESRQDALRLIDMEGANDFFLTAVKYRWGWLAFALVLGALLVLLVRGLTLAHRQSGLLARYVSFAVVLTLAGQTTAYVIQNLGFMAVAAYGLPLLSFGGTYLCQTMLLLGVLLSAHRTGKLQTGENPLIQRVS
ncbi:permease prefix domain 1-containing protein [Agathobaculum sp.]|uniref:permease prefix domain 1-containing protein n=1 Tax=Agathobaculum sp. TaxID=2048138 RepID=UPI002A810708|nr:permease prefix domain 1-containing protein [Agathobaculum sp.]MCI5704036.1 FtsW/RodA/SpoVE family cell cycle protein [Pseudoflavonifractor sp.]MDY3618558.1 permease prefix domain 1-containing protein [Agathobaculum sp.]